MRLVANDDLVGPPSLYLSMSISLCTIWCLSRPLLPSIFALVNDFGKYSFGPSKFTSWRPRFNLIAIGCLGGGKDSDVAGLELLAGAVVNDKKQSDLSMWEYLAFVGNRYGVA